MSVKGLSFATTKQECFVLDYPNENFKSQTANKNSTCNDVKMKDKFLISKMRKKSIITILIVFIFGLSCAVAFLSYLYSSNGWTKHCRTELCSRSAENLLSSMNVSIDPCENFYQFACGNWAQNHPIPKYMLSVDWFDSQQDLLLRNISSFLRKNDSNDEPIPVHQARTLYRSCIKANEKINDDFGPIQNILQQVKLPLLPPFGGLPNDFSWMKSAVLSKGIFNQDFFISFSISSDPENRTCNKLHISKPTGLSPLPVHRYYEKILRQKIKDQSSENDEEEYEYVTEVEEFTDDHNISVQYNNAFINYVTKVTRFVYQSANVEWTEEIENAFNESIPTLLAFHTAVGELIDDYYSNASLIPSYISITELQEMTDSISEDFEKAPIIDWKQYFELMFENSENITLDFETSDDSVLIISDLDYIGSIFELLTNTSSYVVEFYMWWTVVTTIAPYTNSELRKYSEEFIHALTESDKRPRELYCADVVNQLLGMAVAYSVVHNTVMEENMLKIAEMVEDIQSAFLQNIKSLEWMDQETRSATVKKITAMKKYIGFPKWLKDNERLISYYDEISVTEDDFLNNILNQIQGQQRDMLEEYREPNDFEQEMWISNPMDVNAYNFMEGNTITTHEWFIMTYEFSAIPAGILQFPFYGQGIQALNYGAIGSIIGHEMTHSFDNTGKEYDDGGNTNPWWTNKTINEFRNRAQCFINYYGSVKYPEGMNSTINGMKTLDENIADNGGIRNALFAYRNYVQKNGPEPILPDLKMYSPEQLFFLAFANTWCEHTSKHSVEQSLHDEHSPNSVRVLGTLSNSKEFAQIWKCKPGTSMNPRKDKCQMW